MTSTNPGKEHTEADYVNAIKDNARNTIRLCLKEMKDSKLLDIILPPNSMRAKFLITDLGMKAYYKLEGHKKLETIFDEFIGKLNEVPASQKDIYEFKGYMNVHSGKTWFLGMDELYEEAEKKKKSK